MTVEEQVRLLKQAMKTIAMNTYVDPRPSRALIDIRYLAEEALTATKVRPE